jgi:hypothetical protein
MKTLNFILTSTKMYLHVSFTKLKLLLKQFTSIAIAQLEKCELPPSKLTADFILSVVADPLNVLLI